MENGNYRHDAYGMYFFNDGRNYTGYWEEGKIVTVDGDIVEDITPDYMNPEESAEGM